MERTLQFDRLALRALPGPSEFCTRCYVCGQGIKWGVEATYCFECGLTTCTQCGECDSSHTSSFVGIKHEPYSAAVDVYKPTNTCVSCNETVRARWECITCKESACCCCIYDKGRAFSYLSQHLKAHKSTHKQFLAIMPPTWSHSVREAAKLPHAQCLASDPTVFTHCGRCLSVITFGSCTYQCRPCALEYSTSQRLCSACYAEVDQHGHQFSRLFYRLATTPQPANLQVRLICDTCPELTNKTWSPQLEFAHPHLDISMYLTKERADYTRFLRHRICATAVRPLLRLQAPTPICSRCKQFLKYESNVKVCLQSGCRTSFCSNCVKYSFITAHEHKDKLTAVVLLLTAAVASIDLSLTSATKTYNSTKSHIISCINCGLGDSLLFFEGLFCNSCKRKGLCVSCLAVGAYSASSICNCARLSSCFNFGLRSSRVLACRQGTSSTPDEPSDKKSSTLRPPKFPYDEFPPNLKEPIRLLRLYPGKQPDKIKFSLQTHSLLSCPAYEALSYTWAASGDSITIFSDKDVPFCAGRNLATALIALRHPDKPRMLWTDAICINQGDDDERDEQVENMASVYRRATQVLVWLGEASHDSESIFLWMAGERKRQIAISQKIHKATQGRPEMLERLRKYADVDPNVNASFSELIKETVHVLPSEMDRFFDRAYFTRVWVVQEIYYASSIQVFCGSKSVDWDTFISACTTYVQSRGLESRFPRASGTIPGPFALAAFRSQKSLYGLETRDEMLGGTGFRVNLILRAAEAVHNVSTGQAPSKMLDFAKRKIRKITQVAKPIERPCGDLLTVLTTFWSYDATNPLDKVYALLSLVRDCNVKVNYKKSVPDLCKDVAFAIIEKSHSLELLTMANCARKTRNNLPSWAPDWSSFDGDSMPLQLNQAYRQNVFESPHMRPYRASGDLPTPMAMPISTCRDDILTVSGYPIDSLAAVGRKLFNVTLSWGYKTRQWQEDIIQCLLKWDDIAMKPPLLPNGQPMLTSEQAADAFCLTLSRGTYWVGIGNRTFTLSEFQKWRAALHATASHTPQAGRVDAIQAFLRDEELRFSKLGIPSWRNYTFGRTEGGLLVMGIGLVKEGDVIALLKGCDLPLIVRRTDVSGRFKLVGAAYVHGLMDGEGWDESRCDLMEFE